MARILIAEDSLTDIQYIKSVLADTGHDLVVAMDGEEAERMLRTEPFDLVILDVVMPKKNGFQICREIKRDEKLWKRIRIDWGTWNWLSCGFSGRQKNLLMLRSGNRVKNAESPVRTG